MTKLITRFFDDAEKAVAAKNEFLLRRQFPAGIVTIYDSADGLKDKLVSAGVADRTADAYVDRISYGGAVIAVRAGYRPLNVAKTTREVTASLGEVIFTEDVIEEANVKDSKADVLSVLPGAPLMMTKHLSVGKTDYFMANWPIPHISRRKPVSLEFSLFDKHTRMADFAYPLISRGKPFTESLFDRHARMANWPIGLLSGRKPFTGSIISRHGRMANFPISLLSRRKPYTGSLFPRHQRMATWPIALLLNGKRSDNTLIPGGPRMANFPISLLSSRKPYNETAIPRHGRMANFPIGLLSRRKPMTASIIPKHGRMANFILPLTIKSRSRLW